MVGWVRKIGSINASTTRLDPAAEKICQTPDSERDGTNERRSPLPFRSLISSFEGQRICLTALGMLLFCPRIMAFEPRTKHLGVFVTFSATRAWDTIFLGNLSRMWRQSVLLVTPSIQKRHKLWVLDAPIH
jgi:hypothetical protein